MEPGSKLPKQLEDRIDLVDSWIESPEVRSKKVWLVINRATEAEKITNWDIICFCAAYLKNSVMVFPWLLTPVKQLGRLVFNAHYLATAETGLLLDLDLDKLNNGLLKKSESIREGEGISNGTPRPSSE